MKEQIIEHLNKAAIACDVSSPVIRLDYPENIDHGDFSSNVAMVGAKKLGIAPKVLAEKIISEFKKDLPEFVRDVTVAGPGFINFFLKENKIAEEALKSLKNRKSGGSGGSDRSDGQASIPREVMLEFTDPNTFKVFHIGHLMSNAIGESISRLVEYSGTKVIRVCYPADIGLHIAKSIWALNKHLSEMPADNAPIQVKTDFLGKMYVEGTNAYEADPKAKEEIDDLNMTIYKKTDEKVNKLYEKGRRWSLDHFNLLYNLLGTNFDENIYESEMAPVGLDIVKDFLKEGVFKESDGAIVFKGEEYGLHTRVFVNSHGLPTYEAKDLGLNVTKFRKYPRMEQSIIVTASEQNDYFKVLLKVLTLIDKENGLKTKHIGHGMMRFASGKISSRTGNVITAEALIADIKGLVKAKIADKEFTEQEASDISDIIAIGAIKYTILRSSIGSDIIFDTVASISFEGDSGPYLQYSAVRANSIIGKAKEEGIKWSYGEIMIPDKVGTLERMLMRFPDIIERARDEFAPQMVANYLAVLAGSFNSFYASQIIVDKNDKFSPYYVALTETFYETMKDGLHLLGIKVPDKM